MSSVQTVTSEKSGNRGFAGAIGALGRRLSGTFIGTKPHAIHGSGKDKRPAIYTYDEESGQLRIGGISVTELAEQYQTPLYIYDVNRIADNFQQYQRSLQSSVMNDNFTIAYGVKANPSIGIIDLINRLGSVSGTDESGNSHVAFNCVSLGEIHRVAAAGIDVTKRVIFSGIGKTEEEIDQAVSKGIYLFNIESWYELEVLESAARKHNKEVNISIRVNPDISLHVISAADGPNPVQHRFGVSMSDVIDMSVRAKASAYLHVKGLSVHLQITGTHIEPFVEARDKLITLAETLRHESKIYIEHLNLGGGFPVGLGSDLPIWVEKLTKPISDRGLRVILCPGRSLVGDSGIMVSRVTQVKKVNIPIPGSGTSSPRRGSLSGPLSPTSPTAPVSFEYAKIISLTGRDTSKQQVKYDVKTCAILDTSVFDFGNMKNVGPSTSPGFRMIPALVRPKLLPVEYKYDVAGATAEAGDIFARDYAFHEELVSKDSLIVFTETGAYSFSLAGHYGSRIRAAQLLVKDKQAHLIRERESYEDLFAKERSVPATALPLQASSEIQEEPVQG